MEAVMEWLVQQGPTMQRQVRRRMRRAVGARRHTYWNRPAGRRRYYRKGKYKKVPYAFKKNLINLKDAKFMNLVDGLDAQPVSGTSVITYISGVGEGDGDTDRDGRDIWITSVQTKGTATLDPASTVARFGKVMLVLKKDCRGVIPAMTDLYVSDHADAMRTIDNSTNLKILATWKVHLGLGGTANDQESKRVDKYYKFKNALRVKYSGDGALIADADRNALFLVFMSEGAAATNIAFNGQVRITFKDC